MIKPISNYVLLKIAINNAQLVFENGQLIWLDTSFDVQRHASVNCEVVAVPDKLIFGHDLDYIASMPHDTTMELEVGDLVVVRYLAVTTALENNSKTYINENGETCFFVRYDEIYVAKRKWTTTMIDMFKKTNPFATKEEMELQNIIVQEGNYYSVLVLNGWVIALPENDVIKTTLQLPDYLKKKRDVTYCKVMFCGQPNRGYWQRPDMCDDDRLKNGMRIILDKHCDIPLEAEMHLHFYEKKFFYRVERQNIHAFFE